VIIVKTPFFHHHLKELRYQRHQLQGLLFLGVFFHVGFQPAQECVIFLRVNASMKLNSPSLNSFEPALS
jgi:hypothetical protein